MKTIQEILAEEKAAQEAFEKKTMHKGFAIHELRKAFEAIASPLGWKREWAATVPHQAVKVVMVAVEFFHADKAEVFGIEPISGKVWMRGNGYQAH